MKHCPQTMASHFGVTGEHPDFPVVDWIAAVSQYDTRQGYWDWVATELKNADHDLIHADVHLVRSRPPELRHDHYSHTHAASIRIIDGEFVVQGGNADNRRLKAAKSETNFCYVKDIDSGKSVKLLLIDKEWVLEAV